MNQHALNKLKGLQRKLGNFVPHSGVQHFPNLLFPYCELHSGAVRSL
jgi:hypothetical protein